MPNFKKTLEKKGQTRVFDLDRAKLFRDAHMVPNRDEYSDAVDEIDRLRKELKKKEDKIKELKRELGKEAK